jgi:hypothetical protein
MSGLTDLFSQLDSDGSGSITFEEFLMALKFEKLKVMLQSLDYDEKDLIGLFKLMDDEGEGQLGLSEFMYGMSRLQGEPRAKDFLALMNMSEQCSKHSKKAFEEQQKYNLHAHDKDIQRISPQMYQELSDSVDELAIEAADLTTQLQTIVAGLDPTGSIFRERQKEAKAKEKQKLKSKLQKLEEIEPLNPKKTTPKRAWIGK